MPEPSADLGQSAPLDGEFRCAHCGNGDELYACAYAVVSGSLLPDGSVTEADSTQMGLAEDSIDCAAHPAPELVLERWSDGYWCRWLICPWFKEGLFRGSTERCVEGRRFYCGRDLGTCPSCEGKAGSWVPVRETVAA